MVERCNILIDGKMSKPEITLSLPALSLSAVGEPETKVRMQLLSLTIKYIQYNILGATPSTQDFNSKSLVETFETEQMNLNLTEYCGPEYNSIQKHLKGRSGASKLKGG